MSKTEKITKKAIEIIKKFPSGIRYSELIKKIKEELPDENPNNINGAVFSFKQKINKGEVKDIISPERGFYISGENLNTNDSIKETNGAREIDFYQSFAKYLVDDLGECTKAIPLGGNKFQDRWGTPDVLGVYNFNKTDPIQPESEIVSAEIKLDTNQLIVAFGQACSYKIFSHKVYLVIPKEAEKDTLRVESLCQKFGLGLILFDKNNFKNPAFEIRTRAAKSEPDYFYVNKYLRLLGEKELRELF